MSSHPPATSPLGRTSEFPNNVDGAPGSGESAPPIIQAVADVSSEIQHLSAPRGLRSDANAETDSALSPRVTGYGAPGWR